MTKFCPNGCKGLFFDEFEFCYNCGAELEERDELKCVCGGRWLDCADFCPYCGRPREEAVKNSDNTSKEVAVADSRCKYCNTNIAESYEHCPGCGRQVREALGLVKSTPIDRSGNVLSRFGVDPEPFVGKGKK